MKYIIKHLLLFNLFLVAFALNSNAQPGIQSYEIESKLKTFWPSSVSASQLFSKPPEDIEYVTGRATIRIPLYEIRTADFVLPISIYFTTGGIKIDQLSGNIGAGWQLEAEPMITRTVRGRPDEFYLIGDSAARYAKDNTQYRLRLASGQADVEQDIFYYRLLSGRNKFLLGESDNHYFRPIPLTNEGVRINAPSPYVGSSLDCPISITDPSGNLYVYGNESSARERTYQGGDQCITTWKASEIVSPDGDYLRFSYIENAPEEYPYSYYCYYMVEDRFGELYNREDVPPHPGYWEAINGRMNYYYLSDIETSPWGYPTPIFKLWDKGRDIPYANSGSSVRPRPIKRIDFAGGSVRFIYNANFTLLQRVEVYSDTSLIRSIRLSTIGSDLSFLDKVEIFGSDEKNPECYRFDYLPNRKSSSDDDYIRNIGRKNVGASGDAVPKQKIGIANPNGNADLSLYIGISYNNYFPDYRLEEMCRVVYPSGGYTEYTYENGWAENPLENPAIVAVAGKRLSSITEHPVCGKPIVRTFKYGYTSDFNGVGYTSFPLTPNAFSKEYIKHYVIPNGYSNIFIHSGRCRLYTNQNFLSSDEKVYYPYVLESIGATSTLYKFNCIPNFISPGQIYSKSIDEDLMYTKEASKELYRNTSKIGIQQDSYEYLRTGLSELNTHTLFEYPYGPVGNGMMDNDLKYLYLNSFSENYASIVSMEQGFTLSKKENLDNSDIKERSETHQYSTTNPRQLLSVSNENERIDFVYPKFQYPVGGVTTLMKSRNELTTPLETLHYVNGELRNRKVFHYEPDTNTKRGYSLSYIEESTSDSGNDLRKIEQYGAYLRCGKPSQVTQLDGTTICFVWAYGGIHPIATITGMTAAQVSGTGINLEQISTYHSIPESIYTRLNSLRVSHPEARVTTYRYLPMIGQVQQTDPSGVSVYYDYDNLGRLSTIKNNDLNKISTYEYHETNP